MERIGSDARYDWGVCGGQHFADGLWKQVDFSRNDWKKSLVVFDLIIDIG